MIGLKSFSFGIQTIVFCSNLHVSLIYYSVCVFELYNVVKFKANTHSSFKQSFTRYYLPIELYRLWIERERERERENDLIYVFAFSNVIMSEPY